MNRNKIFVSKIKYKITMKEEGVRQCLLDIFFFACHAFERSGRRKVLSI